ncbi:MAG: hypothetical protein K2I05_08965 [Mailhella sp.]|nr:hypothetical protein [Mailhella sp.]
MDNEADGEAWEKLGAIKMPESMAAEIFGNNIRYADNTTCVITENQDNIDFPFNVQFDSSKIPAKPQTQRKLTDSYISGLGMPAYKFIVCSPVASDAFFTAPANGYFTAEVFGKDGMEGSSNYFSLTSFAFGYSAANFGSWGMKMSVPVRKGDKVTVHYQNISRYKMTFWFSQGEI